MNDEFTLRLGLPKDFDSLFEIYMDKGVNPFLSFEIMDKKAFKPIFDELFHSGPLYVYETHNQIVATCIVRKHTRRIQHVATLSTLATHPQWQRKGIGTKFINELLDIIKTENIKRVDLWAEADNPGAIRFYQKLGFKQEGVLKKYFLRANENVYVDEHILALIFD